jgi:hypothetical protein
VWSGGLDREIGADVRSSFGSSFRWRDKFTGGWEVEWGWGDEYTDGWEVDGTSTQVGGNRNRENVTAPVGVYGREKNIGGRRRQVDRWEA